MIDPETLIAVAGVSFMSGFVLRALILLRTGR